MNIISLTKDNFDEIIMPAPLALIEFWAKWCGPCKSFAHIYEQAAKNHPEIIFGKVDIENEPELANDFNVKTIPFIMILKKSTIIFAESGTMPLTALEDLITKAKEL